MDSTKTEDQRSHFGDRAYWLDDLFISNPPILVGGGGICGGGMELNLAPDFSEFESLALSSAAVVAVDAPDSSDLLVDSDPLESSAAFA